MKKKENAKAFYISLIVVLVLLIFVYSYRTYSNYSILRSHRQYFRQPNPEIQPWMTVHSVIRHFNISQGDVFHELKVNATILNSRLTIESICTKNHLNCTEAIRQLNSIKHND